MSRKTSGKLSMCYDDGGAKCWGAIEVKLAGETSRLLQGVMLVGVERREGVLLFLYESFEGWCPRLRLCLQIGQQ